MAATVDQSEFDRVIAELVKNTGRNLENATRFAYIQLCTSLGAASKPGKKNRSTARFTPSEKSRKWYKSRGKKPPNRAIEVYRQGSRTPKLYPYTGSVKTHRKYAIKNRGLAKRSWIYALRSVGSNRALPGKATRSNPKRHVKVENHIKSTSPNITVTNFLPYLRAAYPAAVGQARTKAANKMRKQIELGIKRAAAKANQ